MTGKTADGAPDPMPLMTPGGRGTDWHPQREHDK